jgi:hypothetical protein
MKKLADRLYIRWSSDGIALEATNDYKNIIEGDETEVVVGVYELQHLQVVRKDITLSTKKVSKRGKIGSHP